MSTIFLWRDLDITREPDTYVMNTVSFGDKPAGTITTVALRKAAEMMKHLRDAWIQFFFELKDVKELTFKRCLKPGNAIGEPTLISFSDGSEDAFGACCYVRWTLADGSYEVNLVTAKNRIMPMKTITIVRTELCTAIMATKLAMFVKNELHYKFSREYFFVDSEIIGSMINKESYGLNTFVAVRIAEIQGSTNHQIGYG